MSPTSRMSDLLLLALAVIGVAAIAATTMSGAFEDKEENVSVVSGEGGYPEPPTATPAPTPDQSGLLPLPSEITSTRTIDISESEWADVLVALRNSLMTQDAASLASYLAPQGVSVASDGAGYIYLSDPNTDAVAIFDDLFQSGSAPVIQGYFVEGCMSVFVTGWQGSPTVPTPVDYGIGAPPATMLPDDAYMWQVCEGVSPYIDYWRAGDYYDLVTEKYGELVLSYLDETEIEDWPQYTIINSW